MQSVPTDRRLLHVTQANIIYLVGLSLEYKLEIHIYYSLYL